MLLMVFGVSGEPTHATVTGIIIDEQNEPLMGVTVLMKHLPTCTFRGAITRPDGRFALQNIRSGGPYTLTLSYTGYKNQTKDSLLLEDGKKLSFDFKMMPNSR